MAKQQNQYYIGRQGNLIYYQWRDVYCIRTKGSLDRKRFFADKAFEGSRKRAVEFGEASKLASEVYQLLPGEFKKRGFIGTLTGWAHKKLMNGKSKDAVINELLLACGLQAVAKRQTKPLVACTAFYIGLPNNDLPVEQEGRSTQTVSLLPASMLDEEAALNYRQGLCLGPPGE